MKSCVVYYSTTGNTEAMANIVAEASGAELINADSFTADQVANYDAIAFGCPAMGQEVLEEDVFEPMFTAVEGSLSGKKVALFGSYGWGDGEWMRNWEERCKADGAVLVADPVICQEAPDADAEAALKELAAKLA
ncbi:MAG: flavodoxin [Spirochaetales bacterium]|nr:flavodoxin [Spirochaetales bacterium]